MESIDVLELLITNGADIDNQGNYGYTILHSASESNDRDIIILLEQGAIGVQTNINIKIPKNN
jgi:ankyrin repeat protein